MIVSFSLPQIRFNNLNSLSCTFKVKTDESSNELVHKYNCICFILTNDGFIIAILLKISVNQIFNSNIFKIFFKISLFTKHFGKKIHIF